MATQQFNLRWNNHTSNILQVFLEHLTSESLVDVTLSCQGRFVRAHKIILSACSPYFQELFAHHVDKHPIIILKGIKYDDLCAMIKFMYNGEIRVEETQLDELLAAAELLQVKGLSNVRSKYERGEITSLQNPMQKGGGRQATSVAPNKTSGATRAQINLATSVQAVVVTPARTVVGTNVTNINPVSAITTVPTTVYDTISSTIVEPMCPIIVENSVTSVGPGTSTSIAALIDPKIVAFDSTEVAEKSDIKTVQPEIPRVRKRRKMSHIVNELARETVFSSNGVILLEPDETVVRNLPKINETQTTNRVRVPETGRAEETLTNDTKKLKVKITAKQGQTSLLIKEKEKESSSSEGTKIPRPPNAFMIFANEWRRKLAIEYPKENNSKISVRLGTMWKGLTIQAKEMYYRLAKKADEEHKLKYPHYRYSPKTAKSRRNFRTDSTISKYSTTGVDAVGMVTVCLNGEEGEGDDYTDSDDSRYDDEDDLIKYEQSKTEFRPTIEKVKGNSRPDDKSFVTS